MKLVENNLTWNAGTKGPHD